MADKGRPLPKFGEWDVNDPASAEGFTVIFNKARNERKTGAKLDSPSRIKIPNTSIKWFLESPNLENGFAAYTHLQNHEEAFQLMVVRKCKIIPEVWSFIKKL